MGRLDETQGEDWAEMARMYKKLTVGVSDKPIEKMLEVANAFVPFSAASGIHDSGCGPGAVISRIISQHGAQIPPACTLSCSDFSQAMVDRVQQTKETEVKEDPASPWSRVRVEVLNAMDLQGMGDGSNSHVTAGWVYFMAPDPRKCLTESLRVLRAGGVLTASSWKGSDWLELMKLVTKVKPGVEWPGLPQEWSSAAALKTEFETAGFKDVESLEVPVEMMFDTYEALADLLTLKLPNMVAMMKDFSEKEREDAKALIIAEAQRMTPTKPYMLHGVSLVAAGRK